MKRISKGYSGVVTPLFNTMLVQHQDEEPFHETTHESSPLRITSLPSLSPQTHLSTSQPQTTFVAEEPALMPHESPLQSVHSLGRDEGSLTLNELMVLYTTLSKKVEDLQQTKKVYSSALTKLILRVKKLGKQVKTSKAIRRVRIVLSKDEDAAEDSSKQGRKISKIDTHPSISLGSCEKGEKEVSIVGAEHSTVIPEVSTATANLVYIRRSVEKRKDKGKAIMREDESVQKKTKKQLEQERLTRQEQEVVAKDDQAHVIDWSDPVVIRYHAQQNRPYSVAEARKNMCIYLKNQGGFKMSHFKGMSYDDIRPIFEKVWDQNQSFVPMDSEKEKGSEKKGSKKKSLARKRATEKQSEESTKRQKIENDIEKDELKAYLDLVPREEFAMEIESLATKYLIVDWKTHVLTENFMYYQIIRADGGSKNLKFFSEMLDDFNRQDILFQPDKEYKVWRHQHEYNLISWRLFDSCRIHILLMDNGIAIHMMIEKKYPLTQKMLSKMLSRKLEVDHENEMAFELQRFIRSQVQQ
ncbi:hypothetical protein Tco_1061062 [Tanacetum coccineum]